MTGPFSATLTRRRLLHLLASAAVVPAWRAGGARAQDGVARPFFLILDDITSGLPAEALGAVISAFSGLAVPMGFVLRSDQDAGSAGWAPLVAVIRDFVRASPGLGEVIAWAPGIADEPPYFQARAATLARRSLLALLARAAAPETDLPPVVSIAGWDPGRAASLDAVRAAGFRNAVLLPRRSSPASSARCADRVACLRNGLRVTIAEPLAGVRTGLEGAVRTGGAVVMSLSLGGVTDLDTALLRGKIQDLAGLVAEAMRAGHLFAALPRQHVPWFAEGTERRVGLRIEAPPATDPEARAGFEALARALHEAGIGFSRSPPVAAGEAAALVACDGDGPAAACAVAANASAGALAAFAATGGEIVLHPAGQPQAQGIDAEGLLHLDETITVREAGTLGRELQAIDPLRDIVLSVAGSAYATAEARADLVAALTASRSATGSLVQSVSDHAAGILPDDTVYRVMLATRRARATGPAAPATVPAPDPLARAEWIEDARIAWSYVARLTETATGLCPSTAFFDGEWSSFYRFLTMWDLGSLIQATLAAHEIGLIDDAAYRTRIEAILAAIPAEPLAGHVLPSEEIRTDRRQVSVRGFNACDTGRLLGALREVEDYPLSRGLAAPLVARWTLAAAMRDGQLPSYSWYGPRPLVPSHCGQYLARALARWGIASGSPYDAMRGDSPTDARMRLLYEVARIGAIGAEPMLLELVEMGGSPASDYLADVLQAAQERSHAADGRLVCVSETPMDRAPWFSTQGLAVDEGREGRWRVQTVVRTPDYATPEFEASAMVFSSKAAFLWAALRPGSYATRLLERVRSGARASEAGYAAGLYVQTGAPMTNYTDINTNGIILESVAYVLRGRRPRSAA